MYCIMKAVKNEAEWKNMREFSSHSSGNLL